VVVLPLASSADARKAKIMQRGILPRTKQTRGKLVGPVNLSDLFTT